MQARGLTSVFTDVTNRDRSARNSARGTPCVTIIDCTNAGASKGAAADGLPAAVPAPCFAPCWSETCGWNTDASKQYDASPPLAMVQYRRCTPMPTARQPGHSTAPHGVSTVRRQAGHHAWNLGVALLRTPTAESQPNEAADDDRRRRRCLGASWGFVAASNSRRVGRWFSTVITVVSMRWQLVSGIRGVLGKQRDNESNRGLRAVLVLLLLLSTLQYNEVHRPIRPQHRWVKPTLPVRRTRR